MRPRLPLALLALAGGCGAQPPATFVGESTHFRLYVDPELLPLPGGPTANDDALAALETNWADVGTMLKMPDGKIAYYWYASAHISDACDGAHVGGCTKDGDVEIDAPILPDTHELVHAYTYLRAPRRAIPFLAEGIAEAIGCMEQPIPTGSQGDWRTAVAAVQSEDVYGKGGLFVRQLIRRHGIDDFLRYYEQSPERRDPALFAANFQTFWGQPLDDAWAELIEPDPDLGTLDQKICPCSLPALDPQGEPPLDAARAPYFTMPPDLGGDTIALTGRPHGTAHMLDCAGLAPPLTGKGLLARLQSTAGWYVPATLTASAIGNFAGERCADITPYALPSDFAASYPFLSVTITTAAPGTRLYIAVEAPTPTPVSGADAICDSCAAFDTDACPTLARDEIVHVSGTFYARLRFDPTAAELRSGLTTRELRFLQ